MYTFVIMFMDLIKNRNLHWFFIFFAFILVRWAIVFFNSLRYKSYKCDDDKVKLFSSVIIPVVDEPVGLFQSVLEKIAVQKPSEIVVVINGPKNYSLEQLCISLNEEINKENLTDQFTQITCVYTPVGGKRNAIRVGMDYVSKKSDVTILVDSDTIWTKRTLIELLKPFALDEKIGGVTTRQKIYKPNRNLVTMFANLLEEIRAEGSMKAMSATGKVGCLPGRTIAFRTSIMRASMDEFMTEEFMGIHKEVSDDRSLTNITLKMGYKTVMQDTSVVYTDAPLKWKKFIRQQLRWAEGSQYNNLRMTGWMLKHAKLMCFIFWTDIIMPMILVSVYANMAICMILNKLAILHIETINYTETFWVIAIFIFLGSMLGFGARNVKVMSRMPWYYIPLIPVFIIVLTIIMVPVRLVGLSRCADGLGWGTRKIQEETENEKTV